MLTAKKDVYTKNQDSFLETARTLGGFRQISALLVALCIFMGVAHGQVQGTPSQATIGISIDNNNCSYNDPNVGTTQNSGTISITINNNETESINYLCGVTGAPYDNVKNLANAFNAHSNLVTATVTADDNFGGGTLVLVSKATGLAANYPISVSLTYDNQSSHQDPNTGALVPDFTGPAFIVSAPATMTQGADPGFVRPKYVVLSVIYAPPGAKSSVDYGNSTTLGTSSSQSHSFSNQTTLSISGNIGPFQANNSTSWTAATNTTDSISIQKSSSTDIITPGPLSSAAGIDHDQDVIYLWLNPEIDFLANGANTGQFTYKIDPTDPAAEMDVQFVYVAWLKNPSLMPAGVAAALARSWAAPALDGSGPGLTTSDFQTILARDPFANGSTTIDSTRFDLQFGETFPYEPPDASGQPSTTKRSVSYAATTTQGQTATDTFSLSYTKGGTVGFQNWFSVNYITQNTLTWTNAVTNSTSSGTGQSATISITGPLASDNYQGPTKLQVYKDNVYGTFLFAYVTSPTFTLSSPAASQTTNPGGSATYTISTTAVDGFNGQVTFSNTVTGLPAGATVAFNPGTIGTPGSTTFTVNTTSATPVGTYSLVVEGSSPLGGGLSENRTITLTLVVAPPPDFTISASPSSRTVVTPGTTTYTVTVGALNGFNGNVNLSVSGLPANATASFSPNPVAGAGTSTLTLTVPGTSPAGTYTLTIGGTSGNLSHTTQVTLTVVTPDFILSASPGSASVLPGQCTNYTITITPQNGFNGTVNLSLSGLPGGATANFNPTSVTGSGSITITICTTTSTPAGSYTITVTGSSGSLSHTVTLTLVVQDFTVSATPASQTVTAGGSTSYTVSTASLDGFNGSVSLSASGLPSGASASFNPTSISGTATSAMTVSTSTSTPAGTYTVTINGTNSGLTRSTTVTLVVNPAPDFSLSATPSSQTVVVGGNTSYTASTSVVGGFGGNVALSVSGLPAGATGSFSATSITGAGSSTLSVATTTSTPAGTYTLTITGTSGSLTHTATVTLVVNVPPDFSLSATPSSQTVLSGANTTYTVSTAVVGGFSGNVALSLGRLPAGATGSFSPTSISGAGSSTLTITTSSSTPAGTYDITVTGTSGSLSHTATVTLVVTVPAPDFSLSASPSSQTISQGGNTTYTLSTSAIGSFSGTVALSLGRLPTGTTGSFNPTSITGSGSSTLTITTSSSTPVGTYNITVTGTSGSLTHTATVQLVVTVPTTVVTFDNPVPPGNPGDPLNGVFQGIDFGSTGSWAWEGAYANDNTNNIFFNSGTATSESFKFASGTHVLVSLKATTTVAGTLTLTDDTGQSVSQSVPTGTLLTVTTGWTKPSTTITVSFTAGWNVALDDITYQ